MQELYEYAFLRKNLPRISNSNPRRQAARRQTPQLTKAQRGQPANRQTHRRQVHRRNDRHSLSHQPPRRRHPAHRNHPPRQSQHIPRRIIRKSLIRFVLTARAKALYGTTAFTLDKQGLDITGGQTWSATATTALSTH